MIIDPLRSGTSFSSLVMDRFFNKQPHEILESYWFPTHEGQKDEVTVQDLLEIWRDLLQNTHPDFVEDDLEYITVDGTTNEYDDRGLDFDILSNTKE